MQDSRVCQCQCGYAFKRTGAAVHEYLRRDRTGRLMSPACHACGSTNPFCACCCHSSRNHTTGTIVGNCLSVATTEASARLLGLAHKAYFCKSMYCSTSKSAYARPHSAEVKKRHARWMCSTDSASVKSMRARSGSSAWASSTAYRRVKSVAMKGFGFGVNSAGSIGDDSHKAMRACAHESTTEC